MHDTNKSDNDTPTRPNFKTEAQSPKKEFYLADTGRDRDRDRDRGRQTSKGNTHETE